jgi:hypothetical protein
VGVRRGDTQDINRFQTDRYFRSEGAWFFATREGVDFGPYTIRIEAEKALKRYLETQVTMASLRDRDPTMTGAGEWSSSNVASAAKDVTRWRDDRKSRPDDMYTDRADKHK